MSPEFYSFFCQNFLQEDPILQKLREKTSQMRGRKMQISPEQGHMFRFILNLLKARDILEIGTFAGYSALAMALELPEDGILVTCDLDKPWLETAQEFWSLAGVDHKIDLRKGNAIDTLRDLQQKKQKFDFIFIDADKENNLHYYQTARTLLKPRGVIAIDNVFWKEKIQNPSQHEDDRFTHLTVNLNQTIRDDKMVRSFTLPLRDGVTFIMVR